MPKSPEQAIERYLRCGEHDAHFPTWPGASYVARAQAGEAALRRALMSAVRQRTAHATHPEGLGDLDVVALTRGEVLPMVRGLFPGSEQASVIDVLRRSLVFLTPATIDAVLRRTPWLSTAWDLANRYLAGVDAELLSDDAPNLVGLSEGTICYLSAAYLGESGRFDDFFVHEPAHTFHNCKRCTIGLHATQWHEWLLEIDFAKRETFAYACETYSRIHELGKGVKTRQALLAEYAQGPMPADDRVDAAEYLDILGEAVAVRNGWKRILANCAPPRRGQRRDVGTA